MMSLGSLPVYQMGVMSLPIGLALLSSLSSLFLHKDKIKKFLQCDKCSGGDASHCIFSFLFAFSFLLLILISFLLHVFLLWSDRLYGFLFMTSLDLNDNELEELWDGKCSWSLMVWRTFSRLEVHPQREERKKERKKEDEQEDEKNKE